MHHGIFRHYAQPVPMPKHFGGRKAADVRRNDQNVMHSQNLVDWAPYRNPYLKVAGMKFKLYKL
jgi:hypothetical protein